MLKLQYWYYWCWKILKMIFILIYWYLISILTSLLVYWYLKLNFPRFRKSPFQESRNFNLTNKIIKIFPFKNPGKVVFLQMAIMWLFSLLLLWIKPTIPDTHPLGPNILWISEHTVHLGPWTSGLQTHRPVICSQSSLTEPKSEQPHAKTWKS